MHARALLALTFLCVSIAPAGAFGAVIFDEIQTGDQLAANTAVSFPTVTPTVNGSSLDFGVGSAADVLLRWTLLPAAPRDALHIAITIEYEELTADNDPRFGISDGSSWQGGSRTDQGFFTAQWATHDATTVTSEGWSSWCESIGAHVPSNPIGWELHIAAGGAGPGAMTSYQEGASFCAGPTGFGGSELNEDQEISFLFYRDYVSGTEQYRIASIRIVVSDDSPSVPMLGPSGAALLLLGLLLASLLALAARARSPALPSG